MLKVVSTALGILADAFTPTNREKMEGRLVIDLLGSGMFV
jgi:hypothetical protein